MSRLKHLFLFFPLLLILLLFTTAAQSAAAQPDRDPVLLSTTQQTPSQYADLLAQAAADGQVRVIVELSLPQPFMPEGDLPNRSAASEQRDNIARAQANLLRALSGRDVTAYATYDAIPAMALLVDENALQALLNSPLVNAVQEDEPVPYTLDSSIPVIGADDVWSAGYEGTGQTVVILDTGIDSDHDFFEDDSGSSRIVTEACFSNAGGAGGQVSLCPGGGSSQTGAGAANVDGLAVCLDGGSQLCDHGIHVAGIAAGNGPTFSGVAPDANIIPIQVFTRFNSDSNCGGNPGDAPCVLSYGSDQLSALNYVYNTLRLTYNIASVNMSLGGGSATANCDTNALKPAIDNLRSIGAATVIATGNDGWTNAIGSPACISTAIAVGSTTDADSVSSFSNVHAMMHLFAPGSSITSAIEGNTFGLKQGTSMATPHVAGAWALLKSASPAASVDDVLSALQSTGVSVTDSRSGGSVTKPRIQLDAALGELAPSTWEGDVDSNWHTAGNWNSGAVPTSVNNVIIPSGLATYPILAADGNAGSLSLQTGAILTMTTGTLSVSGEWDELGSGQFHGTGGTVRFEASVSQTITQTAGSYFNHVQIGDGTNTGAVTPATGLDINGNLTLKSGATLPGGSQTISVGGDWYDEGIGFVAGSSTVHFDGSLQTVDKVVTTTLLNETFSKANIGFCGCSELLLPDGWIRESNANASWLAGDLFGNDGEAIFFNDTTDGWLHTAALELYAGVTYQLSFDYNGFNFSPSPGSANTISAYFGTAANSSSMTTLIGSTPNIITSAFNSETNSFTVPTSGTYYIGFRGQRVSGTSLNAMDNVVLTGTGNLAFHNLQVSSSGAVTLTKDAAVANDLTTHSGGLLNLGGNTLTVEGTVSNNGSLRDIRDTPNATTTSFLDIRDAAGSTTKYQGVDILPSGGNMGATTVTVSGNQYCTTSNASEAVRRCFDITPTTAQAATVTFYYLASEANGNPEGAVNIFHWNGTSWDLQLGTYGRSSGGDPRHVQVNGISSYSPFVLDDVTPTAVTLSATDAATPHQSLLPLLILLGLLLLCTTLIIRLQVSRPQRF